jgi:hypothetical protein
MGRSKQTHCLMVRAYYDLPCMFFGITTWHDYSEILLLLSYDDFNILAGYMFFTNNAVDSNNTKYHFHTILIEL